jgi:drug/metabolite transporter (DMT)-like permease
MTSRRTAYLFLLAMAVCWGGTWPAGKLAVEDAPPLTVATARFLLATLLLGIWAASQPGALRRPSRSDIPLLIGMGATAVAGYNVLFLFGLELAPASDGAIIVPGLAPVFTALLAWPLLGERIGRWGAAGLVLAFAGLVLVVNPGGSLERDRALGALLFVGGAVCWSVYSVIGRPATARFGPVAATLYATTTGTLMLVPFSFAGGGWGELAGADGAAWASVLYLAVFGTVLGFVFFYEGISRIGASRAIAFALLVPIFGVLGSVLILGESLAATTLAGGIAIVLGLWLVQRPVREAPAPAETQGLRTAAR